MEGIEGMGIIGVLVILVVRYDGLMAGPKGVRDSDQSRDTECEHDI